MNSDKIPRPTSFKTTVLDSISGRAVTIKVIQRGFYQLGTSQGILK